MKVDIKSIAAAIRKTKSAVEKRANREAWPYTEEPVRGGRRKVFVTAIHTRSNRYVSNTRSKDYSISR